MSASNTAQSIYSQFSKKELISCCEELGIATSGENTRELARMIIEDIETNGIPDDLSEISDTLFEILVVGEWIDEEGNVLEEKEEKEEEKEEKEEEKEEDIPDWVCFSYADSRDPACNRCKLYDRCLQARIDNRPECFGLLYSENEPECQLCIEAHQCKLISINSERSTKNG